MTVSRKDRTNMVRSPLARVAITALFVWSAGAMAQSAAQDVAPPFANLPPITAILPITPIAKPVMKGEFPLYPSRLVKGPDEQWESYLGGPIVRNVVNPTLRVMVPQPGKANGTAVVYAPGGAFLFVGMFDTEPQKLVDEGVTVFILKYRTNPTGRDPRAFLTNMYAWLGEIELYMFFKDERDNPARKHIQWCEAASPLGPFGPLSEPITAAWAEGPTAVQMGDDIVVFYDRYLDKRYGAVATRDMSCWRNISAEISMPAGASHGTVVPISGALLDELSGL